MSDIYRNIWKELGLNMEAHDGLLGVLSDFYKNIYLSQKNRPETMKYFDFVISEVHSLRIKELYDAKKKGSKIIGTFCVFVPEELILAVDGIAVGLCAGAELGYDEAEQYIPRNTCALIKAFMGSKLAGLCPYVEITDLLVGETTCDGKKKAYEILNDVTEKVHVMEIPNMKQEVGRKLWKEEVKKFALKLEEISGKKITRENLKKGVEIIKKRDGALKRLSALRGSDPSPVSGLDALLVNQISFYDDPLRFTEKVNELCDELEERIRKQEGPFKKGITRILVSGSPMAVPNWKLHSIIEGAGALVAGEESCVGERKFRNLIEKDFSSVEEGLELIAEKYLSIDCACFSPNNERLKNIENLAKNLNADGIIHYSLHYCTPYMIESHRVKKHLEGKIPLLRLESDYSMEDMGQLKTRIEAFLEMLEK